MLIRHLLSILQLTNRISDFFSFQKPIESCNGNTYSTSASEGIKVKTIVSFHDVNQVTPEKVIFSHRIALNHEFKPLPFLSSILFSLYSCRAQLQSFYYKFPFVLLAKYLVAKSKALIICGTILLADSFSVILWS